MKASNYDILREILKSKSRFLSIFFIVLLGTLVFVGLSTTTHNIKKNTNSVLQENNIYDLRLDSYVGLSDRDFELINKLSGIKKIVMYNEYIDKDNNLIIENKDIKKNTRLLLKNSDIDSKYYDITYINKSNIKNGIHINDIYFENNGKKKDVNVVLIYLDRDKNFDLFSKKYLSYIKEKKFELRQLFQNRPEEFKTDAIENLDKNIEKIDKAYVLIDKNKKSLQNDLKTVEKNRKKLESAKGIFKSNFKKIEDGFLEIKKNEAKLEENENKIDKGLEQINKKLPEVLAGIGRVNDGKKSLEKSKNSIFLSKQKYIEYKNELENSEKQIKQVLNTRKSLLENKEKIKSAFLEIKKSKTKLLEKKAKLDYEYNKYVTEYRSNVNKLETAKSKIQKGFETIKDKKKELKDKKAQIIEVKSNFIKPQYAISTVYDNLSFQGLYNNINSMALVSAVFTSLFFLISLFIISTTIIRFSIEQRNIVGTYKFLGYSNAKIVLKFVIYAMIPTVLGIIIGTIMGTYFVPSIIYPSFFANTIDIFGIYTLKGEALSIILNLSLFILVIILTIVIILKKILSEKVIDLLNQKSDDKIRWHIKNIVLRNLLKYKLRLFMTLLGISLCTSLIYLGLGLRYSMRDISKKQYNEVEKFDAKVFFKPGVKQEKIEQYIKERQNAKILRVNILPIKVENKLKEIDVQKVEIIDKNYEDFLNFQLEDGQSAMTESLSDILGLKNKDKLVYYDLYNILFDIKIDKTFKNYISQYIYTKNKNAETNAIYIKYMDNKSIKNNLQTEIVHSITESSVIKEIFNDQISSLDVVVAFMVILGGSLAVLVSYNLANINIIERRRELATLEVLGYYKRELDLYIFREIIILASISIILGMGLGELLTRLIAYKFIESIVLVRNFNIQLLIYSYLLPLFFIFIVLFMLGFKIRKINMIESLKMSE